MYSLTTFHCPNKHCVIIYTLHFQTGKLHCTDKPSACSRYRALAVTVSSGMLVQYVLKSGWMIKSLIMTNIGSSV